MFTRPSSSLYMQMAERGGFEPPVHLCGHTHDFQSCSFGLSDISPASRSLNKKRKSNIRHAARDLENLRPVCIMLLIINNGGERGIRTPVGAFGPQIDFESIPLRPLRYLSALNASPRTNRCYYSFLLKKSTQNFSTGLFQDATGYFHRMIESSIL